MIDCAGTSAVVNQPRGKSHSNAPPRRRKARIGGPERIAEKLGTAILKGVYRPRELVPGEMEVCRRFGASRPVVREAFRLLAGKGFIASRRRAGTYVRPREDWHMLDADVLAWRLKDGGAEPKFAFDLLHARAVVEPAAAAMAARAHTPDALRAIEVAFADMERTAGSAALFAAPDIHFHKAILAATGNDVMVSFGVLIEAALALFVRIASRHRDAPAPSLPLHLAVLEAIRRRDAEGAHAAMMVLLDRTSGNVRRNVRRDAPRRSRRAGQRRAGRVPRADGSRV
jgi:DNA-binding FadR family transcriptional regulator